MKWIPRSLSGQLLALWLVAMLVTHLIAVLFLSWWRVDNTTIHPMSARAIETRVIAAYRAVTRSSDAEHLVEDISLPDSRFWLVPARTREAFAMGDQEREFARSLREKLNVRADTVINVWLSQTQSNYSDNREWWERFFKGAGTHSWALDVEISLPDGQWLESRNLVSIVPSHWGRVLSFSLLVGMIPATLIAMLFGRRIMRPLRVLKDASRRVSRGEQVTLPQPAGPQGVREITKAFNDMQESLIRFVKGRTEMIAAIGHDIRTPITSLRIQAELVEDDEIRGEMIKTIDELGVIVEGTLQFAKDESLQEPTQDVLINHLIDEVVKYQRTQKKDVSWSSEADSKMFYRCRPVHLKRALTNIIDNGTRYGAVRIRVEPKVEHGILNIEVSDDGPGIDSAKLEQVFEPFVRLDASRNQDTGGIGLGLSIARSCIRAHGGEVKLCNRPEGGLSAIIALPI